MERKNQGKKGFMTRLIIFIILLLMMQTASIESACDVCTCIPSATELSLLICNNQANLTEIPGNISATVTAIYATGGRLQRLISTNFQGLDALEMLDFSDNIISAIDNYTFIDQLRLESLLLRNNEIREINHNTFQGLRNLTSLNLASNKIGIIPDSTFQFLVSLQVIELQNNRIRIIREKTFSGSSTLLHIDLSNNQVTAIASGAFQNLDILMTLALEGNNITTFYSSWFLNKSLDINFNADMGTWVCTAELKTELQRIFNTHPRVAMCDGMSRFCPTCSNFNGTRLVNLTFEETTTDSGTMVSVQTNTTTSHLMQYNTTAMRMTDLTVTHLMQYNTTAMRMTDLTVTTGRQNTTSGSNRCGNKLFPVLFLLPYIIIRELI